MTVRTRDYKAGILSENRCFYLLDCMFCLQVWFCREGRKEKLF